MSECDSISRTIKKGTQDIERKNTAYADPFYRLPPKPTEIPTQVAQRKFWNQILMHWNRTLTQILKKIPHIKKV